ncbi:transcription factor bHLH123-like [Malania oleifera]|uniref:transcription factor bHLH123-like n=1 Tax=Malania oleifera TaxID=397392 RepID=UPI0025ADD2CD|nr:transcription factor bHLH123-like [Malania oleifera]
MAEEYQTGVCSTGNWWDSSRNRFDSGSSPSSSTLNSIGSFGWPTDMADIKARSSMDSATVSGSSVVFQDTQKLQGPDSAGGSDSGGSTVLTDPNLQMMGLGLSCQAMDWNQQDLLRSSTGKPESSFRSMLEEDMSSNANFQQETAAGMATSSHVQWRNKIFAGSCGDASSINEFKQMNRLGFSLDQTQFDSHSSSGESTATCQGLQMDNSAGVYGSPTMLQGLLGYDHNQPQPQQPTLSANYPYHHQGNLYTTMNSNEALPSTWSKFPQFLRTSPPKQTSHINHLQFSNNAPYWNASTTTAATNNVSVRSGFFPTLQTQVPTPTFNEKLKSTAEVRDSGTVVKKNGSELGSKRPRNETPLPAFKVRKEKMGDRITALQQLVSPFGKTDTASVLSEAIEYIKFLHQQVSFLSTPYMNSTGAASIQHQQNSGKSKDPDQAPNLRSRGLCLVPISSTFPVTHETTVDFWAPTFGGSFR